MPDWTLSAFSDEAGASCEEQIAALKQARISRMDLRSIDSFNCTLLPVPHAKEVRKKLDAAGIQVQMFGSPIGKIDIADDFSVDVEKLKHLGQLAPVLGCHAVRIFSYYNKTNRSHDAWRDESLRRLRELSALAVTLKLVLYHENERHIFGDLCQDVQIIARELRKAGGAFRMIFDFDNYTQSGENAWENWLRLGQVTDAFHLKDSRGGQHHPVGQGDGYVREILVDALKHHWKGPLAVEPHLSHSGAVAQTGPSGMDNVVYSKMPPAESFHIACTAATGLLNQVGASYH
ncbi:MAG: sugar phosphate isomerase/epimerase [Phycisphaerae bacterium]|nr:sugar phosphate isomerase/epimerase [Phycisphaerae bacterium]